MLDQCPLCALTTYEEKHYIIQFHDIRTLKRYILNHVNFQSQKLQFLSASLILSKESTMIIRFKDLLDE